MSFLTSFDGRISRKSFWLAFLIIAGGAIAVGFALLAALPPGAPLTVIQGLVSLGLLYIWAAIIVKRLHDRDKAAMPWAVIFLFPSALNTFMSIFKIGYTELQVAGTVVQVPGLGATAVMWATMAISLWMVIELGFLKGTDGENRYGPDPRTQTAAPQVA